MRTRAPPGMKTTFKPPEHSIFDGADRNDLVEIEAALVEDPQSLNDREFGTGKTATIIAAADGNYLALQFLVVARKADPWIKDNHGRLALDYARAIGHQGCRQLLLEAMFPDLDGEGGTPDVVKPVPR